MYYIYKDFSNKNKTKEHRQVKKRTKENNTPENSPQFCLHTNVGILVFISFNMQKGNFKYTGT